MTRTLLRGATLVDATDQRNVDVAIENGEILSIENSAKNLKPANLKLETVEAQGFLLLPLLIDCHVHFREPGLAYKATMETEAASALAGGIGTVCEMPNTIPPTVTIAALADKVRRAADIAGCQIKFFFGITQVAHLLALKELWTGQSYELKRLKHHCCGVKLYLDHSTGDQKVDDGIIEDIFRSCAELKIPLVAHCEYAEINSQFPARRSGSVGGSILQPSLLRELRPASNSQFPQTVELHSKNRPPESEAKAIEQAIDLVRRYQTLLHIAHLSTKQGIELVRQAKKENLPVTCEVAPHHLFLTIEDYRTLGALAKMNPPLRSAEHQQALWEGIADRTVDCIATDHAPHTLDEKKSGEPLEAPSGVPGVETMLPLLLTVAAGKWPHPHSQFPARRSGSVGGSILQPSLLRELRPASNSQFGYADILRLCFTNPNRIFSLDQEEIVKGKHARLMLVDPKIEWTIEARNLHSKCGWTSYEGWKVQGKIVRVIQN